MANWLRVLAIKDLISDDDSSIGAVRLAKRISKRLKLIDSPEIKSLIDYFDKIKKSDADPLAEVNEGLKRLYDWADLNRVWIK